MSRSAAKDLPVDAQVHRVFGLDRIGMNCPVRRLDREDTSGRLSNEALVRQVLTSTLNRSGPWLRWPCFEYLVRGYSLLCYLVERRSRLCPGRS